MEGKKKYIKAVDLSNTNTGPELPAEKVKAKKEEKADLDAYPHLEAALRLRRWDDHA